MIIEKVVDVVGEATRVQYESLTDDERLHLGMACFGCVSGQLSEWPVLCGALRKLGWHLRGHEHTLDFRGQRLYEKLVCLGWKPSLITKLKSTAQDGSN